MTAEKGTDRLQSLIAKYRSYGEQGERKIKPISLSGNKMGLVTRGRSFGPAAPKNKDSEEAQVSSLHWDIVDCDGEAPTLTDKLDSSEQGSVTAWDRVTETLSANPDEMAVRTETEGEEAELDTQEQHDIDELIQR